MALGNNQDRVTLEKAVVTAGHRSVTLAPHGTTPRTRLREYRMLRNARVIQVDTLRSTYNHDMRYPSCTNLTKRVLPSSIAWPVSFIFLLFDANHSEVL